jgi:hypothetical protein
MEDVKELYFHQVSSPTLLQILIQISSKWIPIRRARKQKRSREEPEYEILDTQSFDKNAYFDCFIEYAKADTDDILMKVTVVNRGSTTAEIHVLPQLWFRNFEAQ